MENFSTPLVSRFYSRDVLLIVRNKVQMLKPSNYVGTMSLPTNDFVYKVAVQNLETISYSPPDTR
jgi:hypothetical protein